MSKSDIKKVIVLGSGALKIGQAGNLCTRCGGNECRL